MSENGDRLDTAELASLLRALYEQNDDFLRLEFKRSLPFQDGMFDRWERAKRLGFGEGSCVYNSSLVMGDVSVGAQTWVGPYTFLDGGYGRLSIGAYCSISAGVHIYTHDTVAWSLSGGKAGPKTGDVSIADCVYIGSQSIIGPGVTIGTQAVVATNSYVNCDVAPKTIVGGAPCRILGTVEVDGEDVTLKFSDHERTG